MKETDEALMQSRFDFVPDLLADILEYEYVPSLKLSRGKLIR